MFVHPRCTNSGLRRTRGDLPESVCVPESPRACQLFAIARALPSPTMFAFSSLTVKLPILSGRITFAADLLFRSLAHRAETALRPSSLLCSGVNLENRIFPPLRPPSLPRATACGFFDLFVFAYIAAPGVQFLAAHFQTARHQARRLSRPQSLHRIQLELPGELPSRSCPVFPFAAF